MGLQRRLRLLRRSLSASGGEILVGTVMKCIRGEDTCRCIGGSLMSGPVPDVLLFPWRNISCVTVDALDISREALAVAQAECRG